MLEEAQTSRFNRLDLLIPGIMSLALAGGLVFIWDSLDIRFNNRPELGVISIGGFIALMLVLILIIYGLARRRSIDPIKVAGILLVVVSISLASFYFFVIRDQVAFPGDYLIWSESDFVNDILKYRVGYPIYTDQQNNESFIYPFGTQFVTYQIASALGQATSIPIYREIQVGFTLLSAFTALFCVYQILQMITLEAAKELKIIAGLFSFPVLYLIATNPVTNQYTHNLHNDALAQLVSVIAFLLLLMFIRKRRLWLVIAMALVPAIGLWVKQSLLIWLGFYLIYLLFLDRPRNVLFLIVFCGVAIAGVALTLGISYLLWGNNYFYWVFTVLGSSGVSPLRSFRNFLAVWPCLTLGLAGGLILLRGRPFRLLIGAWVIWLGFIGSEIYTSGIAWMTNHIGPGTLIAGVWFTAGIIKLLVWSSEQFPVIRSPLKFPHTGQKWAESTTAAAIGTALILGQLIAIGVVRVPVKTDLEDLYRYQHQIEAQFAIEDQKSKVLLDAGTWIYLQDGLVMKDRSPGMGDRGYNGSGDFSGILQRLDERIYSKILVRNLNSPEFWYDHYLWARSSGVRKALLDNYEIVGEIPGVIGYDNYLFSTISILKPRSSE